MTATDLVVPRRAIRPSDLVEESIAIGDRIVHEAIGHEGRANWLVRKINYPGETQPGDLPTVQGLNGSVYSGTAGIALFLARLHTVSHDPEHKRVALAALRTSLRIIGNDNPTWRNGYYLGRTGVAYAAHEAARLLGDDAMRVERDRILDELWAQRTKPSGFDVVFGHAGAIPALLRIHEDEEHERAFDLALDFGARLLESADIAGSTYSWRGDGPQGKHTPNHTGFSHGAAGAGWGLSFLARATGSEAFYEAARGAFAYERRWFDAERGSWQDLRNFRTPDQPIQKRFAMYWCHGAPGIGLARVHAIENLGDKELREELRIAARRTREYHEEFFRVTGRDVCVCHGLAGNSEALWMMEEALGRRDALERARAIGAWALERYGARVGVDWPTGVVRGQYPPLITGVAGAGHWLLRLHDPTSFPSVIVPAHPTA